MAGKYAINNLTVFWQPTPVFLPGESHGQRSLWDYGPWGCKESDTAEHAHKMPEDSAQFGLL